MLVLFAIILRFFVEREREEAVDARFLQCSYEGLRKSRGSVTAPAV